MIEPARLKELSDAPETNGEYALSWMQQAQRADFNPALETAIACAKPARPAGSRRVQPDRRLSGRERPSLMLEGLRELEMPHVEMVCAR